MFLLDIFLSSLLISSSYLQICGIAQCSDFNIWLYVVLPAAVALVSVAVLLAVCCFTSSSKKPLSVATSSPRSFINPSSGSTYNNHSEMEMNSLLPNQQQSNKLPKVRAREFPISAVRFVQEMGDGAFGKVYRGELGGIVGGSSTLVAVKTLKIGANQATRGDFQRDSELMADLRHPNIVCLVGVCLQEEPQCMVFEHMAHGDLHEFLIFHRLDIEQSIGSGVTKTEPSTDSYLAQNPTPAKTARERVRIVECSAKPRWPTLLFRSIFTI